MLRYSADRRTIVFVVTFYMLVTAAYVFQPQTWTIRAPLIFATCLMSFFGAVIAHNTIHVPIFHSQRLNRGFQVALTLVYGHPVSAFVPGHNLSHHRWSQGPKDVMRTSKARFRWNLLNQLFFAAIMAPAIARSEKAFTQAMKTVRPAWYRQLMLEMVTLRSLQIALLGLAYGLGDISLFFLHVIVPYLYAAWGIIGINYVQHDGTDAGHEFNHARNVTGKFVNWWVFNNGFHSIHHHQPDLHWSLAPKEHARVLHSRIHPALEQKSLLAYAFRAYVWPGRRVDYLGKPVFLSEKIKDEDWVTEASQAPNTLPLGAVAQ